MLLRIGIAVLTLGALTGVALINSDEATTASSWKNNILIVAPMQMKPWKQVTSNERMERINASKPPAKRLPIPPPNKECPDQYCTVPSDYLKLDMTGSYYKGGNEQYFRYTDLRSRARTAKQRRAFYAVRNNPYRFITSNCSAYTAWVIDRASQGRIAPLSPLAQSQMGEVVARGGTSGKFSKGLAPKPAPPGGFRVGDLVFFNTYDANGDGYIDNMTHVGVMVSATDMLHSGSTGNGVARVNLRQYIKMINAKYSATPYGWARLPDRIP